MTSGTHCLLGDAALATIVTRACGDARESGAAGPAHGELLRDRPGRSRLFRVKLRGDETLVAKRFLSAGHRRPRRERAKAALGLAAAQREARALLRLTAAGVPVPMLRTLVRDEDSGDFLLVTRQVEGETLRALLAAGDRLTPGRLRQLGAAIRSLHTAGFIHGDLHAGNIVMTPDAAVLIDLQSARRSRTPGARRRDLAFLDHSLAPFLSTADRVRLRAAALGATAPFDPPARRALCEIGRRSESRGRSHANGRTRRAGAVGRMASAFRWNGRRGLRARSCAPAAAAEALAGSGCCGGARSGGDWTVLKSGRRFEVAAGPAGGGRAVVKTSAPVGILRSAVDALRGSPARRAWLAGHGLRLRGVGAAAPLAYVEERRFGLPRSSASVAVEITGCAPADACPPAWASPAEVAGALLALLLRLHRTGVDHGDLKASHVLLLRRGDTLASQLVDLESVRFRRRIGDRARIRALAQLNASLPDAFPNDLRRWVFDRYAAALPFRSGKDAALARIVAESLARRHRWSGAGCDGAAGLSG